MYLKFFCWIWSIIDTIVVHDPRVYVCHDLEPNEYIQGQGHVTHVGKFGVLTRTFYRKLGLG